MPPQLSVNDIVTHIVKFGMDVYPQIDIASSRTKLNIFAEEMKAKHPKVFDKVVSSDREFVVSKEFRVSGTSAAATVPTLVLADRGPVFVLPLMLPHPFGSTGLEDSFTDIFLSLQSAFFSQMAPLDCLRLGMIREVVFETGQEECSGFITDEKEFSGAPIIGADTTLTFRDSRYNHRITIESAELMKQTQLAIGQKVTEPAGYALKVKLDVNNDVLHALADDEINEIIERANSLWPDALLGFVSGGST